MNTEMRGEVLKALRAMRHVYKGLALGGWVTADKQDLLTGVEQLTSLIVRIKQLPDPQPEPLPADDYGD